MSSSLNGYTRREQDKTNKEPDVVELPRKGFQLDSRLTPPPLPHTMLAPITTVTQDCTQRCEVPHKVRRDTCTNKGQCMPLEEVTKTQERLHLMTTHCMDDEVGSNNPHTLHTTSPPLQHTAINSNIYSHLSQCRLVAMTGVAG